jgi:hypothetical protein
MVLRNDPTVCTDRTHVLTKAVFATGGVLFAAVVTSFGPAQADPPSFPDINNYAPVDPQDYAVDTSTPGIPSTGTYFLTPDGILCGFSPGLGVGCTGNNLPAIPPATGGRVNEIGTNTPLRQTSVSIGTGGTVHGHPVNTLPPLHSIVVTGIACGVDGSGTTACKDSQGHGFVLSPAGSGWLPHV